MVRSKALFVQSFLVPGLLMCNEYYLIPIPRSAEIIEWESSLERLSQLAI